MLRKMSLRVALSGIMAILLIGLSFWYVLVNPSKVNAEVKNINKSVMNSETLVTEMEMELNRICANNEKLALSSNPYDYIEDNKVYEAIIDNGTKMLPILEETLKTETAEGNQGLAQYLLAAAIEQISRADLHVVSPESLPNSVYKAEGKDWGSSAEFLEQWEDAKKVSSSKVRNIFNSNITVDKKIEELKPFGLLIAPELNTQKIRSSGQVNDVKVIVEELNISDSDIQVMESLMK
ncbi:hypothetical protein [Thomasclavelia sp.]